MGTLVTLKRNVWKKGNKICANLEALGPLELKKTHLIPATQIDYLELPVKETPGS